ncbi:DUF1194 domain-containing protein [Rhabdaerophilum sp. SD176]|uniref:DUF1194 domain-containing protein n=1 Tax=Rhabdaerophilum sp. SD176 TaxID=2983548 RepID=UPI0024DFA9F3|nr:DUF1194 domain-containing protein [Rhabdaerophilum sp. SD176]
MRAGFASWIPALGWPGKLLPVLLLLGWTSLSSAQSQDRIEWPVTGTEVDVALVLAVDISYSMDLEELALQREGYIAALTSPVVLEAIRKGMIGRIGVTYIEWAGLATRNVIVDWKIIDSEVSARVVAAEIAAAPVRRARRTSITGAIDFSMDRLQEAPLRPLRRVIDISGDGPNNEGGLVSRSRDRAVANGVVINGLPIQIKRASNSNFDIEGLDVYYADCVIGGPGSFLVTIEDKDQFRDAIRTKILREVAQSTLSDAGPARPGRADCTVGERQWRQYWERN